MRAILMAQRQKSSRVRVLLHRAGWAVLAFREATHTHNLGKESVDSGTGPDVALEIPARTDSNSSRGALFVCDMPAKMSIGFRRVAAGARGRERCDSHKNDLRAWGSHAAHLGCPTIANVSHCAPKHRQSQ